MMLIKCVAATGISIAMIAAVGFAPAAHSDVLSASSEASCSAGFPVLTGPGATVLTPAGAYTMGNDGPPLQNVYNPVQKDYSSIPSGGAASRGHKVVAQVKNYRWPASKSKTTTGIAYRSFVSNKRVAMSAGDHFSSQ